MTKILLTKPLLGLRAQNYNLEPINSMPLDIGLRTNVNMLLGYTLFCTTYLDKFPIGRSNKHFSEKSHLNYFDLEKN